MPELQGAEAITVGAWSKQLGEHIVEGEPLLQEVFPMWRELETLSGMRLLTITGALYIGQPAAEAVVGAEASAKAHGLDVEMLDAAAVRRRYPGHVLHDDEVAVLDRKAGFLNPEGVITAMLRLAPDVRRDHRIG